MKSIYWVMLLFIGTGSQLLAQKYTTRSGTIVFEASVPSFEEVKATHSDVSGIINIETGEVAVLALVKGFRFKLALMEEHFNENYVESAKYPKSIFKGQIENFDVTAISPEGSALSLKGTIELHGKTIPLEVPIKLLALDNGFQLVSEFILRPEEFDIKIPAVVSNKIAEEVIVSVNLTLLKS